MPGPAPAWYVFIIWARSIFAGHGKARSCVCLARLRTFATASGPGTGPSSALGNATRAATTLGRPRPRRVSGLSPWPGLLGRSPSRSASRTVSTPVRAVQEAGPVAPVAARPTSRPSATTGPTRKGGENSTTSARRPSRSGRPPRPKEKTRRRAACERRKKEKRKRGRKGRALWPCGPSTTGHVAGNGLSTGGG